MASGNKAITQDLGGFVKFFGAVIAALGGFAGLFVAFGYVTVQSFLSYMRLYGLAYFPLQFYKEASVSLLRDFAVFYLNHPVAVLIPIGILVAVLLVRWSVEGKSKEPGTPEKSDESPNEPVRWKRIVGIVGLILVAAVALLPFAAARGGHVAWVDTIFNTMTIPILVIVFFFLAIDFPRLDRAKPLKNLYFWFVMGFVLVLVSMPVVYGFYLYDIRVFTAFSPYCNTDKTPFGSSGETGEPEGAAPLSPRTQGYQRLYLMGHTSEREIFFDATKSPVTMILVDKKLINSIKVNYSTVQVQTLRNLFGARKTDLLERPEEELRQIIQGDMKPLEKDQLEAWMMKVETPEAKEKRDAPK